MLYKLAEDISFYLITNKIIDIEDRNFYINQYINFSFSIREFISTIAYSILKQRFLERRENDEKHKDKSIREHC